MKESMTIQKMLGNGWRFFGNMLVPPTRIEAEILRALDRGEPIYIERKELPKFLDDVPETDHRVFSDGWQKGYEDGLKDAATNLLDMRSRCLMKPDK